jgi:peptidoglycan/LPS O-acetylase OafA/YrhL
MKKTNILKHILETYFWSRVGTAVIGILFPLILWLIGLKFGVELQGSISAYYHTPMRNVFVGILFAVGASLYLYRGYNMLENIVLNIAGILALCIALLPTSAVTELKCDTFTAPYLHGISAISFFILIACVCIFDLSGTLEEIDEPRKSFYQNLYRILGGLMIVFPLSSALLLLLTKETGSLIFWVELAGVWVFSAYWFVKTWEISESQLDKL